MPTPDSRAAAFDGVAQDYDAVFTDSPVGRAQRTRVWERLRLWLHGRQRVLEVNCGTGTDAHWLATQGKSVLATDISPAMLALVAAKNSGLPVQTADCAVEALTEHPLVRQNAPYDLLFSNFGGLNCVAPTDLPHFAQAAEQSLRPGGLLAVVVMGRFCWWESLYFLLRGQWRKAFRRQQRQAVQGNLDLQHKVATWYYAPTDFIRLLPDFQEVSLQPIGIFLPPSYLDPFFQKVPWALRGLAFLEKYSTARWLAATADHYLLLLEKRNGSAGPP